MEKRDSFGYYLQTSPNEIPLIQTETHLKVERPAAKKQTREDRLQKIAIENRLKVIAEKKKEKKYRNYTINQIEQQPFLNEAILNKLNDQYKQENDYQEEEKERIISKGSLLMTQLMERTNKTSFKKKKKKIKT